MGKKPNSKISEKLKALREAHSLRQADVAAAAEVKQATYSQYETGKRTPSSVVLYRIANYYGMTVDDLLKLCIELDDNIYFDAPGSSLNGLDQADYLSFVNHERYALLGKREKEMLFYFAKLTSEDQQELIEYAIFKRQRYHNQYHRNETDS